MNNRTSLSVEDVKRLRHLQSNVLNGIPVDLSPDLIDYWNGHTKELHSVLRDLLNIEISTSKENLDWSTVETHLFTARYNVTRAELETGNNRINCIFEEIWNLAALELGLLPKKLELLVMRFKKNASTLEITNEMFRNNLRPITAEEILSFLRDRTHGWALKKCYAIGLGSVDTSYCPLRYPLLVYSRPGISLYLTEPELGKHNIWDAKKFVFLAVREVT